VVDAYLRACGAGKADGCLRVEQMCKAGSTYACFPLAEALHRGTPIKRDDARARAIWVKLCAKDHAMSCYRVGELARDGALGPVDLAGAVAAFGKACRLYEPSGCSRQRDLCAKQRVTGCP
jgi:TPR repeat protein